jgi:hypothetical protein
VVTYQVNPGNPSITPGKARAILNEPTGAVPTPLMSATERVGFRATDYDGVTASPKVRQMLNENPVAIQIAPLR